MLGVAKGSVAGVGAGWGAVLGVANFMEGSMAGVGDARGADAVPRCWDSVMGRPNILGSLPVKLLKTAGFSFEDKPEHVCHRQCTIGPTRQAA